MWYIIFIKKAFPTQTVVRLSWQWSQSLEIMMLNIYLFGIQII